MPIQKHQKPTLENLIEHEELGIDIFHPGGLTITKELAELCHFSQAKTVLDVASGSGESAIYLAKAFSCTVTGVDHSEMLVDKSKKKTEASDLPITFQEGDANALDFPNNQFDAVISECTLCLLAKKNVLKEMTRVCKPSGYVGIHDICWKPETPYRLKERLYELEDEAPETFDGWKQLFEDVGLREVLVVDRSEMMKAFVRELSKNIDLSTRVKIFYKVLRTWGIKGLIKLSQSQAIFSSPYTGYGIVVGKKSANHP